MQAAEGDACVHWGGREVHPRPREGTLRLKNARTPLKAPIELSLSCSRFDVAMQNEQASKRPVDGKPVCYKLFPSRTMEKND